MTDHKEWLANNPDVTREQILEELIAARKKVKIYQNELCKIQSLLAEVRLETRRYRENR